MVPGHRQDPARFHQTSARSGRYGGAGACGNEINSPREINDVDNMNNPDAMPGDEIAQLRAKVEELMAERVAPAVDGMMDQAADAAQAATDTVRDQVTRLSHAVQERPFTSLGFAALAGFVLAVLVRR